MEKIIHPDKIIKSVLLSQIITVILTGLLSVVVTLCNIKESTAGILIFAVIIVSVLLGAFVLAKNVEAGGLVNGFCLAVGYYAVLILISLAIGDKIKIDATGITRLVTVLASGMLGGVLGVNT